MARYFIEIAYKGTNYAGSQKQDNANTVQFELEKAMQVFFRRPFELTGSSRTDAGVHAQQNYYHYDDLSLTQEQLQKAVYHLNAILPTDIAVHAITCMREEAHSRFDALSRTYEYRIHNHKDPFANDFSYFYPFNVDILTLAELAQLVLQNHSFETFSKKNTQVHSFLCNILQSEWLQTEHGLTYRVQANRFLRGMVKGLVGTMLRSASKANATELFTNIIASADVRLADFSVPSHGLCLKQVEYAPALFHTH